jgi:hypothetical protein|tara:strand:- start:3353 stop:4309 length:957 start_codon:yes stop_codon:yes gene_type:complete
MAQQIFRNGDASDAYANQRALYLSFFHLASNSEVNFKAFITSYSETFSSEYNMEHVFGRNDPIATFKHTARRVSVSWDVPAASLEEAKTNLGRCNNLAQFMYPAYTGGTAGTLSKPPLMKIRFANLIKNSSRGPDPGARVSGLLAAVNAVTITPSFDDSSGFFDEGVGRLYPKLITISCDFTALHEHDMGWGPNRGFNSAELRDFPFGQANSPNIAADVAATSANEGQDLSVDDSVAPPIASEAESATEASAAVFSEADAVGFEGFSRSDEEEMMRQFDSGQRVARAASSGASAAARLGLTQEEYATFLRRNSGPVGR